MISLLSENIIPGNYRKVFGSNAKEIKNLERIRNKILSLEGIKDVIINTDILPSEFIVHKSELVKTEDIENLFTEQVLTQYRKTFLNFKIKNEKERR